MLVGRHRTSITTHYIETAMIEYNGFGKIPSSLAGTAIDEYYPVISKDDITQGYVVRYFARQANFKVGEITEISPQTYQRIKSNALFNIISMEWKIAGPLDDVMGIPHINSPTRLQTGVITANKLTLATAEKDMPGLQYKLMNPTQFWIGK